ncbi:hypothetical protein PF003_g16726 [Phytophthora fragariae]|nr:hypothetical protein PF003_g16726 [Phytophthora fragariae]
MVWLWTEEFAQAVLGSSTGLEVEQAREQAARKIRGILTEAAAVETPNGAHNDAIYRLLDSCRVFMRDRRGIDQLLSAEVLASPAENTKETALMTVVKALDSFLVLVEDQNWSSRVREEALKCMINSVYSRPEFVSETLIAKGFVTRLLGVSRRGGTASLHWLVWKVLLVSCEAPKVPRYLSTSLETWQLIYATLLYGFKHGNQTGIVDGDRATLLLDLIKLVTVLVNDMQLTADQEKLLPGVFNAVHQLGGLLLEILRFTHSEISPLNVKLIELKNKAMEVFMFLPGSLLAAFVQQEPCTDEEAGEIDGSMLSPVIDHLHAMLLVVRIENTRPLKEMLPTLIVCHNLAKTGSPDILTCFKKAILPATNGDLVPVTAIDRTKAFFFKKLKFFLTCLDTDVRRYTSEWLFLLCDENAKEYTHHTGVGNAIGLLRMKGLA